MMVGLKVLYAVHRSGRHQIEKFGKRVMTWMDITRTCITEDKCTVISER